MRAGSLRHYVTLTRPFERRTPGTDNKRTYVEFAKVYASIRPLSGEERLKESQMNHEVTHEIRLRYVESLTPAGVLPNFRIEYQGVIFRIEYILDVDYKNRELRVRCLEEVKRA